MNRQKTTKAINTLVFALLLFVNAGCSSINTSVPEGDFKFIVVSDIHLKKKKVDRDKRLVAFVDAINKNKYPEVEFVVATGDNVSSIYDKYSPDDSQKGTNNLKRFVDIIDQLKLPKYIVFGNHEYKIENDRDSDAPYRTSEIDSLTNMMEGITKTESYYTFKHNDWKFIILNSMTGRGMDRFFDDTQLKWLENELKDEIPTILFFHHPVETDGIRIWCKPSGLITKEKETDFFNILSRYKDIIKGIFVGHGHMSVHDKLFDSIDVYETDSFGDNEDSPFYLIGIDKANNKLNVSSFNNSEE